MDEVGIWWKGAVSGGAPSKKDLAPHDGAVIFRAVCNWCLPRLC